VTCLASVEGLGMQDRQQCVFVAGGQRGSTREAQAAGEWGSCNSDRHLESNGCQCCCPCLGQPAEQIELRELQQQSDT
jgi:hypothetical protein